jgi:hypothetical protein
MKRYDKRQVGTTWEIFDAETGEVVVMDGRKLNVLDEHRAEETIQLLHAGELTPDDEEAD